MVAEMEQQESQPPRQHQGYEESTQLSDRMLVKPDTQPHRRNVIELVFMQFIFINVKLSLFLFHLFLFLWALITANVYVYLIGHYTIVTELY
jgi:hypothetical protein